MTFWNLLGAGDEGRVDFKWAQEDWEGKGTLPSLDCGGDYTTLHVG